MPDTTLPATDTARPLSLLEKWIAGILLITFTILPSFFIVAFWPDKLPAPKDPIKPLYECRMFHIRLANVPEKDTLSAVNNDSTSQAVVDTAATDSSHIVAKTTGAGSVKNKKDGSMVKRPCRDKLIHINTLLLLLVAAGGFLGNMIHISTSFTTYIGAGQFKRSWLLWYIVRPFTASALAVGLYFVFRGGFLNMSDDSTNINLYGVMTISVFAGLFTDNATQKLKEVFDVMFKTQDKRPDKLEQKNDPDTQNNGSDQNAGDTQATNTQNDNQ